jgi:hypothetical protein
MEVQELANNQEIIKVLIGALSFCFFSIVSLLIYIWKSNKISTDQILEKTNDTLQKLHRIVAVHEERFKLLEKS